MVAGRGARTISIVASFALVASGSAFLSRAGAPQPPSQAAAGADQTVISANGRFVAFTSTSTDLDESDTNNARDVFVRDRDTGIIERISFCTYSSCGPELNGASTRPSISTTGRYVAFQSDATNGGPNDTNGASDILLRDRDSDTTTRVSVTDGEAQANGASRNPRTSDGRFVVFESDASNLVANDTNGVADVFVRDVQAGTTTRVSVSTAGAQGTAATSGAPAISSDSRFVAFESFAPNLVAGDTNAVRDVFVRDRQAATTTRVSVATGGLQGNNEAFEPAISGDGRYVAFTSATSNLVAGDTNVRQDIFRHDRQTGTTQRVSVSSAGVQSSNASGGASVSVDGRYVAFNSNGVNLVPNDTNAAGDIFVRDAVANTTVRASLTSNGAQANGSSYESGLTADGRTVAFSSLASNLVTGDSNGVADVFVRDLATATTARQDENAEPHRAPSGLIIPGPDPDMSSTGRYVAFTSAADNLVPGDTNQATDVFVRDLQTGTVSRVSLTENGAQANDDSFTPRISADGRYVVFASAATNIVFDFNASNDIFLRDRTNSTTTRISEQTGVELGDDSFDPDISDDGRYIVYTTDAGNAFPADVNSASDIVLRDTMTGTNVNASAFSGGLQLSNGDSRKPRISGNGSFILFTSDATNLGSGIDSNGSDDAYVHDRVNNTTERVSNVNTGVTALNGISQSIDMDASGRYALYVSTATNAVAGDTNGFADTFLRDRQTGTNERVSVRSGGAQASGTYGAISADSRWVAFVSGTSIVPQDTNGTSDVYLRDRLLGITTLSSTSALLAVGNGASSAADWPALSADGRYVAFGTAAQLVAGDSGDTGFCCDPELYVRAAIIPSVSSVSGASIAHGATANVTVNGTNFLTGVNASFGNDITVNSVTRVSEVQVRFNITVAAAAASGARTVLVYVPGTFGITTGAATSFVLTVTP